MNTIEVTQKHKSQTDDTHSYFHAEFTFTDDFAEIIGKVAVLMDTLLKEKRASETNPTNSNTD